MRLLTYQYQDKAPSRWKLPRINLDDNINLIGGLSAVGKTRLLNTIFNLSLIIQKKRDISAGCWELEFQVEQSIYKYILHLEIDRITHNVVVAKEQLTKNDTNIISRNKQTFLLRGKKLPALSKEDTGIYLLKEDKKIEQIYNEFKKIYIRRLNPTYFGVPEDFTQLGGITKEVLEKEPGQFTPEYIQSNFRDVNTQLLLLKMHHRRIYESIFRDFKTIFPFVADMNVKPAKEVKQLTIQMKLPLDIVIPVLVIKEKGVKEEIPIMNMSSGMLRCIIQLVDIYSMPDDSIYLIDELENSMGVRALPQMTDILLSRSNKLQLIFTSHLPYVFNNVNIRHWRILTRKGSQVTVTSGASLDKKYSQSHQDAYTQLINSELIEDGI